MLQSFKQLPCDRTLLKHVLSGGGLWTVGVVVLGLGAYLTQFGGFHALPLFQGLALLWGLGLGSLLLSGQGQLSTERQRAEHPDRASERMLSHLIGNLPGFVYRSVGGGDWTLEYLSEGFRAITGFRPEEFVGDQKRAFPDLLPSQDREAFRVKWQQVLRDQAVFEEEYPITTASGETRWLWERGRGSYDQDGRLLFVEGFVTDITQRKRAEEALLESESLQRQLLDALPAGVVIVDPVTRVVERVNEHAATLFGAPVGQLLGQRCHSFLCPASDGACPVCDLGQVMDTSDREIVRADGNRLAVMKTVKRIQLKGHEKLLECFVDVSARKLAVEELRANRRQLTDIIDFLPDATLAIDRDRRVIIWNKAIEKMTGIPAAEMLGKADYAYTIPFYGEARPQLMDLVFEHRDEIKTRYASITRDGDTLMAEAFCNALYDHKGAWVFLKASPLHDQSGNVIGAIESIRDITERKQAEEELRASEAQNRALLNAIPDLIFMNRRDGEFLAVHASDPDLLILSPEAFLHRKAVEVLPGPLAERFTQAYAQALDADALQELHYAIPIRGEEKHFEARVVPCTQDTVITIVRDTTERNRAEKLQRHLQAQLQQAQKMESLGSLAGGVAHDMNNVLGAILGMASANQGSQPVTSPAYQAFDIISKAAIRGGQMVKRLLNFARQSPAEERELDLNAILQEEVRLLAHTTLSKVRLEMDLVADLRPMLGDASLLTHAFMNLCVNAVEAMPEHGTLTLRTRNVDDAWIEVLVEDTGSGMSEAVLEKALDPFFTTKGQGKGTGLGLAMVYSTVKAHRGQLELQSELDQGTRVRLRFPACQGVAKASVPVAELRAEASPRALTVLLVDDDEMIQSSMQVVLEALGHRAIAAASGEEALAKLEAGFQPDVVILDMNMPGLGGTGTLPRLRALHPILPVLLATGRADQTALDLVEAHPHVTLLAKPFSMKQLRQHLEPHR